MSMWVSDILFIGGMAVVDYAIYSMFAELGIIFFGLTLMFLGYCVYRKAEREKESK